MFSATGSAQEGRRAAVLGVGRPTATLIGCSEKEALCLHAEAGMKVSEEVAAEALAQGERTLAFMRRQGLPLPRHDGARGGGPELDLYFVASPSGARAHPDAPDLVGAFETSTAFGIIHPEPVGCTLSSDVGRVLGQAALLALAPSIHPSTLSLGSSQLAAMSAPCPMVEAIAIDDFQRAPELALSRARPERFHGGHLWAEHLDARYGRREAGRLWFELVALAGRQRDGVGDSDTSRHNVYDVLRRLLTALRTSLDDAQLDFAVARAFVGSRSDGAHLVDVERYGDLGRVRFDWAVDWPSLPRRLRSSVIEATGASYLWLDARGAGGTSRLEVAIECEATHAFRWALVTLDAEGKELGRHAGGRWGERELRLSLASLRDVATVLVVGAAGGHDDREHPFDPHEGLPSTAVCEVTLHGS